MKVEKITINKTSEQPDGVEIEIVKPEKELQGRVLSFLLASHLRELKNQGRIQYDLPEKFSVEHKGEGTFVISASVEEGGYYQSPRPVAIVGIQSFGRRFDIIHAEIKRSREPQPTSEPVASPTNQTVNDDDGQQH